MGITPVLLAIYRDRYLHGPDMRPKEPEPSVKMAGLLVIWMTMVMVSPLRADPPLASLAAGGPLAASGDDYARDSAHLKRHENRLGRMQANRGLDDEHTRQAQEEFRKDTAELSDADEQQLQDVQDLRSLDSQVAAGKTQQNAAHQTYKDALHKYGSDDPKSAAARESWKQSQQALHPLLQGRRRLREDVHQGGRLVHNNKVVLGVQKRSMNSDARYRAIDDRKIEKEEKNIADDQKAMAQDLRSSERASSK